MDDKFNKQKDTLIAIKKEINLLHQQVDYLIRNEKPLALLDLDVMMNRTHTLYDLMCGVDLGSEVMETEDEEEELPVGLDTIREMFGIEDDSKEEEVAEEEEETPEEAPEEEAVPMEETEEETIEENEDAYFIEEVDDVTEEESVHEEEPSGSERHEVEDQSFILNFEPIEETSNEEENSSVYTTGDEIEMTIPHLEFPEDTPDEVPEETPEEAPEEIPEESPVETPEETPVETPEEAPVEEAPTAHEGEFAFEPVMLGEMEEKEDGGFELEAPETLGDRLQQEQDLTLADKLQHSTVNSLQSAIGINDKFLFVNELFNGSMEKYNRSIANLDDLKTLNGALIYLNELRVELQWNSSNEAYKKLLELVHRKFGA